MNLLVDLEVNSHMSKTDINEYVNQCSINERACIVIVTALVQHYVTVRP